MDTWPAPDAHSVAESTDAYGGPEPSEEIDDGSDQVDPAELTLIEESLADVEMALERLADGSYGTCEVCSRQIARDQLQLDPTARRCAEHLPLPGG